VITSEQAKAGIKAAIGMEAGLDKVLEAVEDVVAQSKPQPIDAEGQTFRGSDINLNILAKSVRACVKTQRTQAKYLRLVLEGYVDAGAPIPLDDAPVTVTPSAAKPTPVEPVDPNNPLGPLLNALNPKPPPPPHIPPTDKEAF
jgi:hypothetical protein